MAHPLSLAAQIYFMRKSIVIAAVIFSTVVSAQKYELGVKAGVNYSQNIITDLITTEDIDIDDIEAEPGIGIVFGAFARVSYNKWFIQPELLFSQEQSFVKLNDIAIEDVITSDISKIDVPVLIGYKAFNVVRLMAGPVISNIQESNSEPLFSIDNLALGYQVGAGFDISRLTFDARYEGNLSKLEQYIATDNGFVQFDSRRNIIQFTIGYKLFD